MQQQQPPMFTLTGRLVNVFVQPGGTNAKGEEYEAKDKIQILGDVPVKGGGFKMDLVTLGCEDGRIYERLQGQTVQVPIGFYTFSRTVGFFIPKGGQPRVIRQVEPQAEKKD